MLKLKGIDEFEVLRGFMRGLHLDYEAYVELKQPKDLIEALKFAHIYDNIGHRSKGAFIKGKKKEPFSLKMKFFKIEKGHMGVLQKRRSKGQSKARAEGYKGGGSHGMEIARQVSHTHPIFWPTGL